MFSLRERTEQERERSDLVQLLKEGRYNKGEVLRQWVQVQEKRLGKEHVDTLNRKFQLALRLYEQQKHPEAEELFWQSVQGQVKVLGKEHVDTLTSKHWLAATLYNQ